MSSRSHILVCLLNLAALASAQDTGMIPSAKKPLKLSACLTFLFFESPMIERWSLASKFGFRAVEVTSLFEFSLEEMIKAKEAAGVELILLNVDLEGGTSGFAAIVGKQKEFENSLQNSIKYCKAFNCKFIQIQTGIVPHPTAENDRVFEENIRSAAAQLEKENIIGNIESFNIYTTPGYYLTNYSKALEFVKKIDSPYIRLQADLRNWERMEVDVPKALIESMPYISHIQIAQAPHRHEPDTCGTLNYKSIFDLLESREYKGWIGLQYVPLSGTEAGLQWITEMGYSL